MEIENIHSVADLRDRGSISDLVKKLCCLISPLKVEAKTYEELFEIVSLVQKNWLPLAKGPFISRQAEIIFYLTKLEGKQRNDALGMSDDIYEDLGKAKEWYRNMRGLVHPDKGGDANAFAILKKLYEVAIDQKEDENE
ncbi:MAG: hypothetical protein KAY21_06515 [Limnohabitans sp.]|nr:hypothetical protein [Limnohabitans sp.]